MRENRPSRILAGTLKRETRQALQGTSMDALQDRGKAAPAGYAAENTRKGPRVPDWNRLLMTDQQAVLIFLSPLTNNTRYVCPQLPYLRKCLLKSWHRRDATSTLQKTRSA